MPLNEIVTGLASAVGPAGAEGSAAKLALSLLSDYAAVRQDAMGNVIAEMGDMNAPEHILLDAHIDEIGLIVTSVDDAGFLHVARTGGADRRVLPGSEVVVLGKRRLGGIVCARPAYGRENDRKLPEWDDICIDVGFGADKTRELVTPGTRVVARSKPVQLLGDRIAGRALDDRSGAAALIRVVELLEPESDRLGCRLTVLLSTREEVGGMGAETAAFSAQPTQAVAVDVSFGRQPGVPKDKTRELGKGPMIGISPTLDRAITMRLRELAEIDQIPWQDEIMSGHTGTNADNIGMVRGGVRCGLVSIPQRNMHTPAEVVSLDDIENTAQLLAAFVRTGGAPRA